MRVSDDRYRRDLRRHDVALRFIRHEARTHTIRAWTGLSDDRIRKLYRSYLIGPRERPVARHRGKSPQQLALFTRNARNRQEASMLVSLYRLTGALPALRGPEAARSLPGVNCGELLCQAYEIYRALGSEPLLSFEHAILLLTTVARGEELTLGHCCDCGALLVIDRLALRETRCAPCSVEAAGETGLARQSNSLPLIGQSPDEIE